jgi:hypothetical protein
VILLGHAKRDSVTVRRSFQDDIARLQAWRAAEALLGMHAGMGAQKLDASTGTKGCIELQRANRQCIGALSFHLDTHGYDFDHPGELLLRPV